MGWDDEAGYLDALTGKPGFLLVEKGDYSRSKLILKLKDELLLEPNKREELPILFTNVRYDPEKNETTYFFAYDEPLRAFKLSRFGNFITDVPLIEVKWKKDKKHLVLLNQNVRVERLYAVSYTHLTLPTN